MDHLVVVLGEALIHPLVVPHHRGDAQRGAIVPGDFASTGGALSHGKPVLGPEYHGDWLAGDRALEFRVLAQVDGDLQQLSIPVMLTGARTPINATFNIPTVLRT